MSSSYVAKVRQALASALCVVNFPCQQVERHNRPEVEYGEDPELLLAPRQIAGAGGECCLVEGCINSCRVSLKLRVTDELDALFTHSLLRFLMQRADSFEIVRRVSLEGYDVSFLITAAHVERYSRVALIEIIVSFITNTTAEVAGLKLTLKARNRAVASDFKKALVLPQLVAKYQQVSPNASPVRSSRERGELPSPG